MELQLYLDILKRRAWVIIIVAALVMAVVTSAGLVIPPKYEAKVTMRVLVDVGVANLSMSNTYAERLMNTYGRVLTSGPLLAETIDRLSPETSSLTVSVLRKEMVQIEVIPDTELITVAVQDRDPVLAQDIANMLATLLIEYAQDFYVGSSQSTRQILELQLADMEVEIEDVRQCWLRDRPAQRSRHLVARLSSKKIRITACWTAMKRLVWADRLGQITSRSLSRLHFPVCPSMVLV